MSASAVDTLPTREELARRLVDVHKEAVLHDLAALRREVYPEKLMRTVRDKPLICLLAVAGATFLLGHMASRLPDRRRGPQLPHSHHSPLLARAVRLLIRSL